MFFTTFVPSIRRERMINTMSSIKQNNTNNKVNKKVVVQASAGSIFGVIKEAAPEYFYNENKDLAESQDNAWGSANIIHDVGVADGWDESEIEEESDHDSSLEEDITTRADGDNKVEAGKCSLEEQSEAEIQEKIQKWQLELNKRIELKLLKAEERAKKRAALKKEMDELEQTDAEELSNAGIIHPKTITAQNIARYIRNNSYVVANKMAFEKACLVTVSDAVENGFLVETNEGLCSKAFAKIRELQGKTLRGNLEPRYVANSLLDLPEFEALAEEFTAVKKIDLLATFLKVPKDDLKDALKRENEFKRVEKKRGKNQSFPGRSDRAGRTSQNNSKSWKKDLFSAIQDAMDGGMLRLSDLGNIQLIKEIADEHCTFKKRNGKKDVKRFVLELFPNKFEALTSGEYELGNAVLKLKENRNVRSVTNRNGRRLPSRNTSPKVSYIEDTNYQRYNCTDSNGISLHCHSVFSNTSEEDIKNVMKRYGTVRDINFVECEDSIYKRVYVHFKKKSWNKEYSKDLDTLKQGGELKVYYSSQYKNAFWKFFVNKSQQRR